MEGKEDQLDAAFLAGIKEELASIEENEKNIQALSQVFRYYTKYAKQLSQVLYDFAVKQCFPWEIIHAMHLVDDILLMDNTGRYKAELVDSIQGVAKRAFLKVQNEYERKEVAHMLQTWQELRIFDKSVLEAVKSAIRNSGTCTGLGLKLLDEVDKNLLVEDDAEFLEPATAGDPDASTPASGTKRKLEETTVPSNGGDTASAAVLAARQLREAAVANVEAAEKSSAQVKTAQAAVQKVCLATIERISAGSLDRPFGILGVPDGADGAAIRKAYRRTALIIHPDKNPGLESKCQEALIKLQAAREQAEAKTQLADVVPIDKKGDTRSAATAAKNEDTDAIFRCKYPGCELPPCKQCANGCCTRNITHCHLAARKGGLQCFFHPPPRAWARNA